MASIARRPISLDIGPSRVWLFCASLLACLSVPALGQCTIDADCDDSVSCTVDVCDVPSTTCTNTPDDTLCDNGLFCDGAETCDATLDCQAGSDPCVDGISCTVDTCDDGTDTCTFTPDDTLCDNGLFCDGAEMCDATLDCQTGSDPCVDGISCTVDTCDDGTDTCTFAPDDTLCDNGLFCDGAEMCDATLDCQAGSDPCVDGISCTVDTCDDGTDTCAFAPDDTLCDNGLFCDGAETCDVTLDCQAGTDPCAGANPNLVCDEGLDLCENTCLFDCNFTEAIDTGDWSYFLGCFATVINPGDACECADYNGNGAGDTGDVAGLLGCFGQTCPCAGALPAMAGPLPIELRVVVLKGPSGLDYTDVPPMPSGAFVAGETVYAELWVSRARSAADDFACVFADLYFDSRGLRVHTIESAERFSLLTQEAVSDSPGAARNVGGCLGPEQLDLVTGMPWARVATVEMEVTGRGRAVSLQLAPPSSPFVGIAVLGVDRNVDTSQIRYGGAEVRMRRSSLNTKRSRRDRRR